MYFRLSDIGLWDRGDIVEGNSKHHLEIKQFKTPEDLTKLRRIAEDRVAYIYDLPSNSVFLAKFQS